MNKKSISTALFVFTAAAVVLSGCARSDTAAAPSASASSAHSAAALNISDSWVKAAESGMSAAFGNISNASDRDVIVVSATTEASPMVELHETVMSSDGTMQMQAKEGGFVVPARSSFSLEPGGNHIMLMDLSEPIEAGDSITFTLELSDGSDITFTAQGKDFVGAEEDYVGGEGGSTDKAPMDHSARDHGTTGSAAHSNSK